jgi:hypothetical protein
MATGPVNNNPYLQQVLFQNLSSANVQPGQLKSSAQLISSAFAAKSGIATISANGAKINSVSSTIRASGDMQAYEGFQAAVSRAGASSDPLQLIRFSNSADYMAKNDASALNQAFAALGRNIGSNSNNLIDGFNAAFTSTVERAGTEGIAAFNQGVEAIENADYSGSQVSQSENLQKFYSMVRQINGQSEDAAEAGAELNRLAKGVELAQTGDSIWNFFNDFTGPDPDSIG